MGGRQGMELVRNEVGFGSEWFLVRICTSSRGLLHPIHVQTTLDAYLRERESPKMWFAQLCILSLCEVPGIHHPSLDLLSLSHGARATASAMHPSSLSLALTLDS